MAKPLIGYLSMLRVSGVVITDPGTEPGFDLGGLSDLKTYLLWKSSTVAGPINIDIDAGAGGANADYIALVNHNLFTIVGGGASTIEVRAAATFPPATQRLAPFTPAQDTVTLKTFTAPGALRYWRIVLDCPSHTFSSKPNIGELFLGMKTSLPEYLSPSFDPFFKGVEVSGSRSEGGHFLAATARGQTHRGTITFGEAGAARSAFTSDLNAFLDNHALLRRPFVFIVDTDDTDFSAARYVKIPDEGGAARRAVGNHWGRLTFEVDVEEAYMEPA